MISIGNITTGGTGKTPAVIYLAKLLLSKGYKVSVISRGYGRKTAGTQIVTDGISPVEDWRNYGDEPTLIANALPGVPVIVDGNRHRGGMVLVDRFKPDVIIMDDAFQHRAVERDVDIVLINSQDSRATHKLLPYGMLREPASSLRRADLIIFTKANLKAPRAFLERLVTRFKKPVFESHLSSQAPKNITYSNKPFSHDLRPIAVSAIGDREGFIRTLKEANIKTVDEIHFTDHHDYSQKDMDRIKKRMEHTKADSIITTEKDAIKFQHLDISNLEIFSLGVHFVLDKKAEESLLKTIEN